jgi:hypothetical protein
MNKLETHNAYFINGICFPKAKTFWLATPLKFWIVWLICIATVFLGWHQFLNPKPEMAGEWFQRAGSLVVGFALMAEFSVRYTINKLIRGRQAPNNFINKEGMGKSKETIDLDIIRDTTTLIAIEKICEAINIFFVFVGTVIWGYGDIIFYGLTK